VQNQLPADGGFVTAMANLATVTSADRETVATLTKAIATFTEQLKAKDMCRTLACWTGLSDSPDRHIKVPLCQYKIWIL
jgi:hypothetical protein